MTVATVSAGSHRKQRRPIEPAAPTPPPTARWTALTAWQAVALPAAFAVAFAAFALLPFVRGNPRLFWSVVGSAIAVALWAAALLATAIRRERAFTLEVVLRKQHYLQACAQGSVLLYWGWYWRPVYDVAPLLVAQLLFAYVVDSLLSWSRRDTYTLGFGPFPVVFSINLFLWFKQDWFYLQFLMIAVGFAAKELIRWKKDGRTTHIFNPSSFPLAVFSLVLIATNSTHMTLGVEIANTQFYPPQMYLMLFLIGLPGQFLFGVTSMTMSAAVTTYVFGLLYYAATGSYFFFDSYIPIAVFLGMHLLFNDPSTSPRSELGRVMFGIMYGLGTVLLYGWFREINVPAFYDKLLPVPILNLSVQLIDRLAHSNVMRRFDPARLAATLRGRSRNVAYIAVWASAFAIMSAAQGVGDRHPGQWMPFWQQACGEGRRHACDNLETMQSTFCREGSGWACNEFGISQIMRHGDRSGATASFQRSCALGFADGCQNTAMGFIGVPSTRAGAPTLTDYRVVLRGSKGPVTTRDPHELYVLGCREGWQSACAALDAK